MSAPQTNLEKQERRHRGPIIGIIAVVIFALALFLFLPSNPDAPTGTGVVTEPAAPPLTPDQDLPPVDAPTPAPDLPTAPLPDTGTPSP